MSTRQTDMPLRFLFVEDVPADAELAERELRKEGLVFTSTRVETEEAFLRALEEFRPDLIISDYAMPDFDGMSALKLTLERDAAVPFIILTGSLNEEIAVACMKAGATDYVIKEHAKRLPFAVTEALEQKKARLAQAEAEAALRESEQRFRQLFERAPVGYHSLDTDGCIIEINPAWEELTGYTREEALGAWFGDFLAPSHGDLFRERFPLFKAAGEVHGVEFDLKRKDGSVVSISAEGRIAYEADGTFKQTHCVLFNITERKRVEDQIRLSKEEWERTFDTVSDLICIIDSNHTIRRINCRMAEKLGISPNEAVGKICYEYVHGLQSPPDFCPHAKLLKDQQEHSAEFHESRLGGDFLVTCTPWSDRDGEVVGSVHVAHDITERKRVLQTLQESEARYRAVAQSANDAIVTINATGDVTGWNRRAEILFRYTEAESTGQPVALLVPDRYGDRHLEGIRRLQAGGEPHIIGQTVELEGLRKDGSKFPLELSLSQWEVAGERFYTGIIRDITERKQAEEGLKLFRALIDRSNDAIEVLDPETGRFLDVNERDCLDLGYSREEFLALSIFDIDPMLDQSTFTRSLEELRKSGVLILESLHRRKDGSTFPVEVSIKYVRLDRDYTVAVVRDITERKRAEETLREANRQLEDTLEELQDTQSHMIQQERLRALGQMASGIAHDFNNALAPVVGFSDLLLSRPEQLSDTEKVKHYLEVIATGARDAASVVSRLKEFYRKREEGEVFLPVDLNAVVKQAVTLTQPKWKDQSLAAGINITAHTDLGKVPVISGNEAELREALTNLIFNAVDSMPEGGTITIRTRVDEGVNGCRGDRVTLAAQSVTAPPGHLVTLSVSDTGAGMTEEVKRRCLDPFYTTKGTGGTGMGLSMVYGIMLRHSGTIDIESEVGRGTTITLRFPTYEFPEPDRSQMAVGEPVGPLRVLLAEDEPKVRSFVVDALTLDGCTVTAAENGRVALQRFQEGEFDLVITDRSMPEMNGDQLAAAIKEISPQTPVILATGFGDIMLAQGEKPAGVDLVINKPATLITLREAIARVLGQS